MPAPAPSKLDANQVLPAAFDDSTGKLRVDAQVTSNIAGPVEIIIDQASDSIRLGDGTDLVTATAVGSQVGLDVNVVGGVVSGTFSPTGLSTGLKFTKVTVTSTPTKVTPAPLVNRNGITIRVWGDFTVYFGADNTVSSATGYPKMTKEEIALDIKENSNVELWVVCASGQTSEIRVFEVA